MKLSIEELTEKALALPNDARAELADRLAESLEPGEDKRIQAAWIKEAIRRRDEIRNGDVESIPAEEVFERVRQALAK
jgi:putative addiction module component (TIGR02574 family)